MFLMKEAFQLSKQVDYLYKIPEVLVYIKYKLVHEKNVFGSDRSSVSHFILPSVSTAQSCLEQHNLHLLASDSSR